MTLIAAIAALTLVLAGTAAAALVPSVYDPGNTGCPKATYANGVLHLEKNCATTTNASAGADITGLTGQPFTSASFTLSSTTVCYGGSPRFDVQDANDKVFFLGCNNVTPTTNADGSKTYTFTAADLTRINPTLGTPGTIKAMDVLIDVQGTADISNIVVNGTAQVPTPTTGGGGGKGDHGNAAKCKHGGWKSMTNPSFKNQGKCVSYFNHQAKKAKDDAKKAKGKSKHHG
jgi:hypothetical protein